MQSLVSFLVELAPFHFWPYNGGEMKIVNFEQQKFAEMSVSGECPHCSVASHFKQVVLHRETPIFTANANRFDQRAASVCECASCKQFVLVIGTRTSATGAHLLDGHVNAPFVLVAAYPIGKPKDAVDKNVPREVAEDFREAQRCHFIESYKASVVMCRRAIQSSAIALQAKGGRLIDQIDDLFKTGKITEPLKDFAHEVRLTGNDGAHPDKDNLTGIVESDSLDMIEFTQEYLHHVYVMPAKLKARNSSVNPAEGLPAQTP